MQVELITVKWRKTSVNLLSEFRKYIFNIVIVIIISTVIIIRFLIDSISRHKTFKKSGTKW